MLKRSEKTELFHNRYNIENYVYYYRYCLDDTIDKHEFYKCKTDFDIKCHNAALAEYFALLRQLLHMFDTFRIEKEYIAWREKKGLPPFMEIYNRDKKPGTPAVRIDDWRTWRAKAAREEIAKKRGIVA